MDWLASARCLSPAAPSIRSAEAHGAIRQALATVSRRDHQRLIEEGLTPRWSGLHCRARHTHGTDNNKSIAIPCHVRTWWSRLAASAGDTDIGRETNFVAEVICDKAVGTTNPAFVSLPTVGGHRRQTHRTYQRWVSDRRSSTTGIPGFPSDRVPTHWR
jgi:hypothetical protein